MKSRIILVGVGGSGKDFLKRKFMERGWIPCITHTTRPMRSTETDGVDYHFTNPEEFQELVKSDKLLEHHQFNGWYYGTDANEFENANLLIISPVTIRNVMTPEFRKNSLIIFLDIPETIRRERLNLRSDADSTERRIQSDIEDFKDFTDYDIRITNPDF